MKKSNLQDIKILSLKVLSDKVKQAQKDVADLILDKNTKKLKDVKVIFKKRKEIAKIMTIIKQKQLVGELEIEKEVSKK